MAMTLGKRKRRTVEISTVDQEGDSNDAGSAELDAQELFRLHFEARFKPLPVVKEAERAVEEPLEDESKVDSDWDGISDDGEGTVEVVEHTGAQSRIALMSKEELKAFMVRPNPGGR